MLGASAIVSYFGAWDMFSPPFATTGPTIEFSGTIESSKMQADRYTQDITVRGARGTEYDLSAPGGIIVSATRGPYVWQPNNEPYQRFSQKRAGVGDTVAGTIDLGGLTAKEVASQARARVWNRFGRATIDTVTTRVTTQR